MSSDCIFCQIVAGDAPAEIVHQDERVLVFPDINPSAPTHLLVIPREHIQDLESLAEADLLQHIMGVAKQLGDSHGGPDGYRVAVNSGKLADIDHLHFHFLSGPDRESLFRGGDPA